VEKLIAIDFSDNKDFKRPIRLLSRSLLRLRRQGRAPITAHGSSRCYTDAIKESVLKRVLPPNAESIRSVSVDVRIAEQTIRNWIAKVDQGILGDDVQLGPRQLGAPEKFALLLEAAGLKEDERGPWIREKGLHTEHLQLWQQELRDTVAEKSNKDKQDLKDAKKRIKELEKELNRKDKALAEMAALVALKKKLHHILEDSEDD
jgi:transposase